MPAIATNADGDYIFMAIEITIGLATDQIVAKAERDDLSGSWIGVIYTAEAGTASNVAMVPSDPDLMLFYGNFGTAKVVRYSISDDETTDITPSGLSDPVDVLAVDPSDADRIVIGIGNSQDLKYTEDGGTTWSDWNTALTFDPTALWLLWSGLYDPHRYFAAGQVIGAGKVHYSPNEGANTYDASGSMSVTDITNVELTEYEE